MIDSKILHVVKQKIDKFHHRKKWNNDIPEIDWNCTLLETDWLSPATHTS